MIRVVFETKDERTVEVPEPGILLRISIRHQGGIPFKCGGGLCGTCRCRIESGIEHCGDIKDRERRHLTDADFASGYRMACQTMVNGDVRVSWIRPEDRPPGSPGAKTR